jgi:hypothetical protein
MLLWTSAWAAEPVAVGVGAGLGLEMPDNSSSFGLLADCNPESGKACAPVVHLLVPVRVPLTTHTALRIGTTGTFGVGRDVISWEVADPEDPRFTDNSRRHEIARAFYTSLGATVGPEVRLPTTGRVVPYFATGLGLGLAATFHSDLQRPDLFDPELYEVEDLSNPRVISPYAMQPALAGDLALGVSVGALWVELGYQLQYLGQARLRKTPTELKAEREPFGWNTLRLSVGVSP